MSVGGSKGRAHAGQWSQEAAVSLEGFALPEGVTRCRIYPRASQGGSASGAEVDGCWGGEGPTQLFQGPNENSPHV